MKPRGGERSMAGDFVSDIKEIRRRARAHIDQGPITAGYKADRETAIRLLNDALATELVCVLRYKRHHYMATGIHAQAAADEVRDNAAAQRPHPTEIAERTTR